MKSGRERWEGSDLACADEEGEVAGGSEEARSQRQDGFEVLDRSQRDQVGGREVGAQTGGEGLGALGHYIDVRQFKFAGHFAEEGGLLVVRFDERELDGRRPDLQGESWKAGTGTDVDNAACPTLRKARGWERRFGGQECPPHTDCGGILTPTGQMRAGQGPRVRGYVFRKEMAGEEQGLAKMSGHDIICVADGGQIDAGIPSQ